MHNAGGVKIREERYEKDICTSIVVCSVCRSRHC
jgi:hypothetical protein